MNSSTSSSKAMPTQRQIFLRIFLTILIGMAAAMSMVRGFTMAMGADAQELLGRVLEGQNGLKRILVEDEQDLVMVFGSSMVEAGFSPRKFDTLIGEQGGNVSSWNYGFGGLNPVFQEILAHRFADDLRDNDRRLKLLLIEFNPFQTTKTRRQEAVALEEPYMSLLSSPQEIWERTLEDPQSGIRIAGIRWLRDGVSAEAITTYFLAEPFTEPAGQLDPGIEPDDAIAKRIGELGEEYFPLLEAEFPEFEDCDWCYDWKGGHALTAERSERMNSLLAEYYSLILNDYHMGRDRLRRIQRADIEDLNFDEDLVVGFIGLVNALKDVSDNIEVIMLPKNDDYIKNPPEAIARQNAVVARIERETGVTVRNFQKIDAVTNDMFSDTTHLNGLAGRDAFTRFLAEEYGPLLRN